MPSINMVGLRFGRLSVISGADPRRDKNGFYVESRWNCRCDCGNERVIERGSLVSKRTTSCGCVQREAVTTHGLWKHPLYKTWSDMMQRCHSPKSKDYANYSGRGITVCDRWRNDVAVFIADCPPRPDDALTIDRIDNDRGYEPGNIQWSTSRQQAHNTSRNVWIVVHDFAMTVTQWARFFGLSHNALTEFSRRRKIPIKEVVASRVRGLLA